MQSTELALRPSYWASVSGGKDSLFMLNLILHNLDKYPLDGVVHFELEIDYPFIKNVIDYMQWECERVGIRFVRIKPTKKWGELYERYGFPTRKARWCNDKYKLTAKKKLQEFMKKQGFNTVFYIGYCADEEKRFAKRVDLQKVERYPLVEEGIEEETIWAWAKTQSIFNHYYETQKRCGCMYCPIAVSYTNDDGDIQFDYWYCLIATERRCIHNALDYFRDKYSDDALICPDCVAIIDCDWFKSEIAEG